MGPDLVIGVWKGKFTLVLEIIGVAVVSNFGVEVLYHKCTLDQDLKVILTESQRGETL